MANINTPEFRVSWPKVFVPEKNDLNGKMEYSVTAIFPKTADLSALKAACEAAIVKTFGADRAMWPENLRQPFRKCKEKWKMAKDEATGEVKQKIPSGYEDPDAVWISLKSATRPGLVDAQVQDIIEPRQFYGGCWAIASVSAFAYDKKGNRGVSLGLENLQKRRDGDPLGGGGPSKPTDDFKPVEGAAAAAAAGSAGAAGLFD